MIKMNIRALVGINDCTLVVYYCCDKMYRFSVVNKKGKKYTCESSFPTLSSAKLMGISAVERFAVDRK